MIAKSSTKLHQLLYQLSMPVDVMQEGNAETLQMERQTEEEMRADFIAKSLG